jgi:hypothetical protein
MIDPLRDYLLLAILTMVSVSISSMFAFVDVTRSFVGPAISTIACSFPIGFADLRTGFLLADVMKVITGCLIGIFFGSLLYYTSDFVTSQGSHRAVVSTLMSFPVVCLLTFADPVCKSPLSGIFRPDIAIIVTYVMSSFARDSPYHMGVKMLIVYSFASVVTLCVFFGSRLFTTVGSTKSRLDAALSEFQSATTYWFEGLTAFMTSKSGYHENELSLRQEAASQALSELQKALHQANGDDPLSVLVDVQAGESFSITADVMHSQLLAFRGTIFHEGYSEESVKSLLSPIRDVLDKTRMTTVLALRPNTLIDIRSEALTTLSDEALLLYNEFAITASKQLPETHEEIRIAFAITSIARFAMLVDHFQTTVDASTKLHNHSQSLKLYFSRIFRNLVSREAWSKTTNYKHVIRAGLSQQIMAQLLIVLSWSYPSRVTPYLFWALIPVVGGLMSTVGGGLVIGFRNVLGCLLGALLGVLTECINAGNREAIYFEMLIIAFFAKFFSSYKSFNVAALTFASTWNVLSIPNIHIDELRVLLSLISYRLSLTALGVVACAILSVTLFPTFASTKLKKSIARTINTAAGLVAESIVGVVERIPLKQSKSFDESRSVCSISFSPQVTVGVFEGAGSKALKAIRKYTEQIPNSCEEASPEVFFFERFSSSPMLARNMTRLIEAERLIKNLSEAACVLSSISAATRIHENCHSAVFTKTFVKSLERVVDMIGGSAARVAAAVMDASSAMVIQDFSRLNQYMQSVTEELIATRTSLEKSGMLAKADRGGWLLIYVFHFALVEFVATWDDIVDHLERKRRDSHVSSLEESFASPNNKSKIHNASDDGDVTDIEPIELRNLFN